MRKYLPKIVILILLLIILILIRLSLIMDSKLLINRSKQEVNVKTEDIIKENLEEEEQEGEETKLIFPEYVNYKYLPRLLRLGIDRMTFVDTFFDIDREYSNTDYDNDGIDDYTDIYEGAMNYVNTKPIYFSDYYEGGYPPADVGVCTDVVWNALKNAGYDLKSSIDEDIANNKVLYPAVGKEPDPNIDFRRVRNLIVYFLRYAEIKTLDINDIKEWQQGDIVTFGDTHVGIISKYRNIYGVPLLIHHGGRTPAGQYNILSEESNISGHFRIKDIKKEEN